MATHTLKCWPDQFEAVLEERKCFELRHNDRDFKVRDRIALLEWLPAEETYTGRTVEVTVTWLTTQAMRGPPGRDPSGIKVQPVARLGLDNGWIVMGIKLRSDG